MRAERVKEKNGKSIHHIAKCCVQNNQRKTAGKKDHQQWSLLSVKRLWHREEYKEIERKRSAYCHRDYSEKGEMEIDTDSDGDADSDEEIESKFEGEKRSWSRHIAKALYKFLEDEDGEVSKIQIHYLKLKAGLLDVIPTKSFFIVQSSAMAMNI